MNGERIVVTRAVDQAVTLCTLLKQHGAIPLLYPCIATTPAANHTELDAALLTASQFSWLVLTSANTVRVIAQRLAALHLSPAVLNHIAIAAVGPATATEIERLFNRSAETVPDTYIAEALVDAIGSVAGQQILLPQADLARPFLLQALTAAGAYVTAVTAYQTMCGSGGVDLPILLRLGIVDAITFTSASTVHNCVYRLIAEGDAVQQLGRCRIACIGPATEMAARQHGLEVAIMPPLATIESLVAALALHFDHQPRVYHG